MSWTKADMTDQSGKVILITGANSGLGYESALALAEKGATVILAIRTLEKGIAAMTEIREKTRNGTIEVMALDLASLDSVRRFVEAFSAKYDRLDVLLNNAGIMAPPKQETQDGFESQVGVNHLGHFALTGLLLDHLKNTAGSRIVNVSSLAAVGADIGLNDYMADDRYVAFQQYGKSKLSNLLFTRGLHKRISAAGLNIVSVAAHPGISNTNLSQGIGINALLKGTLNFVFSFITQSADKGALPQLAASVDRDVIGNDYFGPDGFRQMRGDAIKIDMPPEALSEADADELWALSESLTGIQYLSNSHR